MGGDQTLSCALVFELAELEKEGELVICSSSPEPTADRLARAANSVVPQTGLTQLELIGIRSLIYHAITDERFFDVEMPTLTGFSADEFRRIAEKLPTG